MDKTTRIAVIGDFDKNRPSHVATDKALKHSAASLSLNIESHWIPTKPLENESNLKRLENFDGIWGAPGDPESSLGVVNAIQIAREKKIPYLGT